MGSARRYQSDRGLDSRMHFCVGSFFEDAPRDVDAYVLKNVIHPSLIVTLLGELDIGLGEIVTDAQQRPSCDSRGGV